MTDQASEFESPPDIAALRKRISELEAALNQSESQFRTLTDFAPVGLYIDDSDGRATYINRKCAELVGLPAEDALNFNWVLRLHPEDRERVVAAWQYAFQNSQTFHEEYRYVHSDGAVAWALGEVVPILNDQGKADLFVGSLTDITDRKHTEMERESLRAQLLQSQRLESLGLLAGGVAHDFNNMLGAIIGYAELAMDEIDPNDPAHDKLNEILKAATRSADITRQLLSFARRQVIAPEIIEVNAAIDDRISMLRSLVSEAIQLNWLPTHEACHVYMDRSALDQILVNLVINAREAIAGTGTICIQTKTAHADNEGNAHGQTSVILIVSDDGAGMTKETLARVFDPFFTTKQESGGTGLGLASVYGSVQQAKGSITAHSEPTGGTNFTITLPIHSQPIAPTQHTKSTEITTPGVCTILVVEDELPILEVLNSSLSLHGFTVFTACSPSEALESHLNTTERIDLLITDIILPEMHGTELAHRLRTQRPNLRCLYMSGYTADALDNVSNMSDHDRFIAKPFSSKNLLQEIAELLQTPPSDTLGQN